MAMFFYLILLLFLIIGFLFDIESTIPLCWFLTVISIILFFVTQRKKSVLNRNWLCPSYILLLGIIIVALQTILNITVGLAPFSTYMTSSYGRFFNQATYIGFISIISYLIGSSIRIKPIVIKNEHRVDYVLWPWMLMLPTFFILFVINIDLRSFITGSHYVGSGGYDRVVSNSSYFEQLLDVVLVIVTSIITYRNMNKRDRMKMSFKSFVASFPLVFWIVLIMYVLLRMLSGDRGPVLYSVCLVFYSYLMCTRHKFKLVTVIIFIAAAAIATSLLGVARGGDLSKSFVERMEDAAAMDEEGKPSISSSTQELANSINTEFIALHASQSPDFRFSYGKYTFFALIGSIPGSSFVLSNVFGVNMRETISSEFITMYHFGANYRYGLGTSPMAEFYLELGILGCIIGFVFLGWIFSHVNHSVFNTTAKTPMWLIIVTLKLASIAIYIPRASVPSCLSKAIYVLIIFEVLNFFFQFLRTSSSYKGTVR